MTGERWLLRGAVAIIEETLAAHGKTGGRWVPEDADWNDKTLVFRCTCGKYVGSVDRHQGARFREHVASEIYRAIYRDHLSRDEEGAA